MAEDRVTSDHHLTRDHTPSRLLPLRILAALGLVVSVYLSILHYQAGSSGVIDSPLCTISATLNCNTVLGSTYARLFKIPIATWAALTYAILLGVSFMGNLRLLTVLCYWAFAFTVYMAGISFLSLQSACLFCMTLYAINTGLFACALRIARANAGFQMRQLAYTLAVCTIFVGGVAWWQTRTPAIASLSSGPNAPEWMKRYSSLKTVSLQTPERYTKGQASAPVTISEFVDFR